MSAVSVAFVDDHPVLLEGVCALFAAQPGFRVVGKGRNTDEAMEIYRATRPDLMFLDLSMPGDPYSAIASISADRHTRVIVYTAYTSADIALQAIESGASAFVVKDSTSDEIFDAVKAALRNETFISAAHAGRVLAGLRARSLREEAARSAKLSERERQVVGLVRQALSNKEIASGLSISEKTVKHHMTNLMVKLNARNRVEVALAAEQRGEI